MKKSCKERLLRKVRIVVNDPDATDDSSSDECLELHKPPKVKRIFHEVTFPCQLCDRSQDPCHVVKTFRKKPSNNPVGVRLRRSGKWAAEINHPITKTKKWLGTYENVEEAAKAYADKRVEYDALVSSGHASVASVNSQRLCSPCVNADDSSEGKMSVDKDADAAASGDVSKEEFVGFELSHLQIPDLSFLAAEEESMVSGGNGMELDFDDGFFMDDFSLLDDDIDVCGLDNGVVPPSELPDFDFADVDLELGDLKFAFADQLPPPLNIACP